MTDRSRSHLVNLMAERDVPDARRAEIVAMLADGLPQDAGSKLIDEVKALPRQQVDDGMVTAKLYNGSTDWLHRMPRTEYAQIHRQLEEHNKFRSHLPAVFVIDDQDVLLVAIEEFNGPKKKPPRPAIDAHHDTDAMPADVRNIVDDLAGSMSVGG